jgi:hypothetical protein
MQNVEISSVDAFRFGLLSFSEMLNVLRSYGFTPQEIVEFRRFSNRRMPLVFGWTLTSLTRMINTLKGSSFNEYERRVHAISLMHRALTEIVTHPASNREMLQDSIYATNWLEREKRHLAMYHLELPFSNLPFWNLRVMNAALILLPKLL